MLLPVKADMNFKRNVSVLYIFSLFFRNIAVMCFAIFVILQLQVTLYRENGKFAILQLVYQLQSI